jgi:hypothetical protein
MTRPPLARELDDDDASERLGGLRIASKGGELREYLNGGCHHERGMIAMRARFERRR